MNMSLEALPVELVDMVFAELPYRSQLCLRETCRYMKTIAESYTDYGCQLSVKGPYDRWAYNALQMKTIPNPGFRCEVRHRCRRCPTSVVTLEQLRASESNGLSFWLKRLWYIKFPKLNNESHVAHMRDVFNILEQKGLEQRIDLEIGDTLWLIGWSFIDMVESIKHSTLNLSVKAQMIARKDFKTRSKDGTPLFSLAKFTDIKLSIPGGRKVSELFTFDEGTELRWFEMNSCGDIRTSLWGIGHMSELLSKCNKVENLHLEQLTVTIDIPLEDDDWSLQNVESITMRNITLRPSSSVRRKGRKGAKGSLQSSGSPFIVFGGIGASELNIMDATLNRHRKSGQLFLDQLFVEYFSFSILLESESFKACPLEHITLLGVAPHWNLLLPLAELSALRTITIIVPFHHPQSMPISGLELDKTFAHLVQSVPSLYRLNVVDSHNQTIWACDA
ncbi:hypothetical protein TRICI_005007 [Trichomonascus ciferrii]|uniref:F-box domain-containing protein n=1 Tax=Trichomonascus ciferrii TaxID=44093 RepID=A0A642UXR1_9ASCO|nr:hypothetical protein TRICI_005007 [Trichomonascus ciferrii]